MKYIKNKLTFFLLIFISSIFLDAKLNEDIRILADNFSASNDTIIATGRVLLLSKSLYINANKVLYHKKTKQIEISEGFELLRGESNFFVGNYTLIKLDKNQDVMQDVFFYNKEKKLWVQTSKLERDNNDFVFDGGSLSSCACENPDWSFTFDSGTYNNNASFMHSYGSFFNIKNVPIFYFPYFGLSTLGKRTSGFLYPAIGYTSKQGFLYAQSYYYAGDVDYDFEYKVNIREKRGVGAGVTYRHTPNKDTKININTFAFEEKNTYKNKYSIKNKKHYGFEISYLQDNILSSKNNNPNSFYASINEANDPDYYATKTIEPLGSSNILDSTKNEDTSIQALTNSKLLYFYHQNKFYFQNSINWHKSLTDKDNEEILQEAPQVTVHKFSSQIYDNLIYSSDVNYANYYRKKGVNAQTLKGNLMLSYSKLLFNNYLDFSVNQQFNSFHIAYNNLNTTSIDESNINNGYTQDASTSIELSTNLLKPYNSTIHSLNIYANYILPNTIDIDGSVYDTQVNDVDIKKVTLNKLSEVKVLNLGVKNSFYDRGTKKMYFKQSLTQPVFYNDNNSTYGDVENSLYYYFSNNGNINNRVFFNHETQQVSKSSSSLSYSNNEFAYKIYHIFEKNDDTNSKDETLRYSFKYTFFNDYTLSYAKETDLLSNYDKKSEYGFRINDDCWSFSLVLTRTIEAGNVENKFEDLFYMKFELKPFVDFDLFLN